MARLESEIRRAFERRLAAVPARPDLRARIGDAVAGRNSRPPVWGVAAASAALLLAGAVTFYVLVARHSQPTPVIGPTPIVKSPMPTVSPTACLAARPAPRAAAHLAYDSLRHAIVMFGGVGASSSDLGDTWTFSDGCWRLQRPATSPPARENPVFAYDPVRKVTVLYGGFQLPPDQQSGQSISLFSDTWIWNGEFWSQVAAASGPHLYAPQGAFDLAHGVLVVFGHNGLTGLTETWIWDGNRWMRKSPAVSPPDRGEAMMGYDPITQRVVLFGGFSNGGGLLGDTWLWDGTNWTQQHPAVSPPPQQNGAMGSGRTLLLYGDQSDTWL